MIDHARSLLFGRALGSRRRPVAIPLEPGAPLLIGYALLYLLLWVGVIRPATHVRLPRQHPPQCMSPVLQAMPHGNIVGSRVKGGHGIDARTRPTAGLLTPTTTDARRRRRPSCARTGRRSGPVASHYLLLSTDQGSSDPVRIKSSLANPPSACYCEFFVMSEDWRNGYAAGHPRT